MPSPIGCWRSRCASPWRGWSSAMTHLANWDTTLELFETEYQLPFLPPDPAAYMAVSIEVTTPILLVLGLLTRPACLVSSPMMRRIGVVTSIDTAMSAA